MNLLARESETGPTANEVPRRVKRAAESILENEALTADLDDVAAKVLLDWGGACAKMIAQSTAGLNNIEAEDAMSPRLRATRRLMRLVNRWVSKRQQRDTEGSATALTKIIEQAAIIYGEDFTPPSDDRRDAFLRQSLTAPPPQIIRDLRALIENLDSNSAINTGGTDGQEKHGQEIYQENRC